jgi:DNA-binding IscR family transcriptional regulator
MNHNINLVPMAMACLQELDSDPNGALTPEEISRRQGVPLEECLYILRQFEEAGILRRQAGDRLELARAPEELTALDILQALWKRSQDLVPQLLYGSILPPLAAEEGAFQCN